uniref:Uncharacterized protein n=1 Tax=Anguilla anguilla TaxID=7936 RepID=A0A0E9U0G7_ANGAN
MYIQFWSLYLSIFICWPLCNCDLIVFASYLSLMCY